MKTWIERALNLRPGDLGRGTLLCSYLFLVISSVMVGKVARDALFLTHFKAVHLPYADIASALLVVVVVAIYVRLGHWVSLRNLLIGSLLFFSANCMIFWGLARYSHLKWLFPVFYIWAGLFGVLAPTQVWTLANYVLTTRDAKRIFGLVGGGAIVGWIFAGFLSKTMAKALGTESLILAMAVCLAVCPVLVILIWRAGHVQLGTSEGEQAQSDQPRNLLESMRLTFSSPYLRAIAAVIWVSSFVVTLTGWQFKAIAKHAFVGKDALAVFFGNFYLCAGALSLILQLLVTGRCLRRFGIGVALFMLPVVVLLGSAGVLAFGTLTAIVMLQGGEYVLRYSIDKSTSELLYLPVSSRLKMQVKWFIDTVLWRMGDGLAGITVLVLATYLHVSARNLSAVVLVAVGGWLLAVFVARQQYVVTLKDCISSHRLEAEQASAPVLDRSTADLLAAKLAAPDPQEILYALRLFEVERERATHPVIRGLLDHPAAEVRQKALSLLTASGDKAILPQVQRLLRDTDLNVRTEALLYLSHQSHVDPLEVIEQLGDFPDFSVRSGVVAYLARPGKAQDVETARTVLETMINEEGPEKQRARLEAARLIAGLPDVFDPVLSILLSDSDIEVVRAAIVSAGTLRKRRLVPELLDRLVDERVVTEAASALVKFGDSILGALRDHLGDIGIPMRARREIPGILLSIGTPNAQQVLMENLLESDTNLRLLTIISLNKLHHAHPEVNIDVQLVETVLLAEIMGHYRSYQILHMLGAAAEADDAVARGLRESMQQELERIFGLLGLLYPRIDVSSVYLGLQSKSASVYDNSLEFLDNVLKSQLRSMLVPLLDGRVTVEERVQLANRLVRANIESQEQAVAALVSSDDPWLKSCGAYAIGALGMKSLEGQLSHCLEHADPLLRETARMAKMRLSGLSQAAKVP